MRQVFVIEARDNGLNPRHGPFATFTEAAALLDQLEARGIHAWTETTETSVSSTPSTAVGRAPFSDLMEDAQRKAEFQFQTKAQLSRAEWAELGDDDE